MKNLIISIIALLVLSAVLINAQPIKDILYEGDIKSYEINDYTLTLEVLMIDSLDNSVTLAVNNRITEPLFVEDTYTIHDSVITIEGISADLYKVQISIDKELETEEISLEPTYEEPVEEPTIMYKLFSFFGFF